MAVALAACGSSSAVSTTTTGQHASSGSNKWTPSPAGKWGREPTVTFPSAAPPASLVKEDLIAGNGAVAMAGDTVTVQYVGASYQIKKVFQASWNTNGPFSFTLGEGQVIPGWDDGVAGMKAGGRRELIIPPAMAYGAEPPPGSGIPPNETLIFIVDLLSVKPG
jgi:peptidylprolyl isomerase